MKQTAVKFQSKNEIQAYSSMGGVILTEEIFKKLGINTAIDQHIGARVAGSGVQYTDSTYVKSFVLMQMLGGDTVDDLRLLREDPVINAIIGKIPGKTSAHNYLASFVDSQEEEKRKQGKSVILTPNKHLSGFNRVTQQILSTVPSFKGIHTVTLDQDATFIPTKVSGALYNYKVERSFEAFNTYCPEYDMMIHSEFRDGNVNPGYNQLNNLIESLQLLPSSVQKVRLRSDTAGYQIELLKYCAGGKNERFGVIDFAIGCPVTAELKQAVLIPKETQWSKITPSSTQECAEIPFAPNSLSFSKKGAEYRFIAIREAICDADNSEAAQKLLFPEDEKSKTSVLHPTAINGKIYKIFALVTNDIERQPEDIVLWHRERCGKSEEIHHILKNELAGGHIVTRALGANAGWWQIAILSANMLSIMKLLCLPDSYRNSRPKQLRFHLFSVVARISKHARKTAVVIYNSFSARLLKTEWNRLVEIQCLLE